MSNPVIRKSAPKVQTLTPQLYNGTCTAGSTFCATFDGNNHNNNGLLVYDAAGNVTMDNMHHYGYDGENRLVSVEKCSS